MSFLPGDDSICLERFCLKWTCIPIKSESFPYSGDSAAPLNKYALSVIESIRSSGSWKKGRPACSRPDPAIVAAIS